MTLKDFLRAWKECEKYDEQNKLNDELREKYAPKRRQPRETSSWLRLLGQSCMNLYSIKHALSLIYGHSSLSVQKLISLACL